MRTSRPMTVSLPPEMVRTLDKVRRLESRTRSELVREALRTYFSRRPLLEASVPPVRTQAPRRAKARSAYEPLAAVGEPRPVLTVLGGADRARLRKQLKEGAIRNAKRSLEMAREWSLLEDEAWERSRR